MSGEEWDILLELDEGIEEQKPQANIEKQPPRPDLKKVIDEREGKTAKRKARRPSPTARRVKKKKREPKRPDSQFLKKFDTVISMLKHSLKNMDSKYFGYEEIFDKFNELFGRGIAGYETIARTTRRLVKAGFLKSKERGIFFLSEEVGKNEGE